MGIKPALGWLGLLLFTTVAQAESRREILKAPTVAAPIAHRAPREEPAAVAAPSTPSPRATLAAPLPHRTATVSKAKDRERARDAHAEASTPAGARCEVPGASPERP